MRALPSYVAFLFNLLFVVFFAQAPALLLPVLHNWNISNASGKVCLVIAYAAILFAWGAMAFAAFRLYIHPECEVCGKVGCNRPCGTHAGHTPECC